MIKLFSKLKTKPAEKGTPLNTELLISYLSAVKINLNEIYNLKSKRVGNTLVLNIRKKVEIEDAWTTSGNLLFETYAIICRLSQRLSVPQEGLEATYNFRKTIEVFVQQIDRICTHLQMLPTPPRFVSGEIEIIDRKMLQIQQSINRLHKHVLVDFDFFAVADQ